VGRISHAVRSSAALLELRSDVDPEVDDLFNNWCDHHHAELLSLPGVLRARRYVRTDGRRGTGRYLTSYDLDSVAVLDTPAFLDHRQTGTPMPDELGPSLVYERTVATLVGWAGDISGQDGLVRGTVEDVPDRAASLAARLLTTLPGTGLAIGARVYQRRGDPAAQIVALLDCPSPLETIDSIIGAQPLPSAVAYRLVFDGWSPTAAG
jgi:hypothetical protein